MGLIVIFYITIIISFITGPFLLYILNKYSIYADSEKKKTVYGEVAETFNSIVSKKHGRVLRMGGVLIHVPVLFTSALIYLFSGSQIILLFIFIYLVGAIIGAIDDLIEVKKLKYNNFSLKKRLVIISILSIFFGFILYGITGSTSISLFSTNLHLGLLPYLILTPIIFLGWYGGAIIDGINGITIGVLQIVLLAIILISLIVGNISTLIIGLILFGSIWYFYIQNLRNKVYLTETGIMPIMFSLAFITILLSIDGNMGFIFVPIAGIVFFLTWLSVVIQLIYRKKIGRKLFKSTPIHHHFQASGMQNKTIVIMYMLTTMITSTVVIFYYLALVRI